MHAEYGGINSKNCYWLKVNVTQIMNILIKLSRPRNFRCRNMGFNRDKY